MNDDGEKVLYIFEEEDDATRYAMMLEEDDDSPEMHIIEIDDDLMIKTCEMHNYQYCIMYLSTKGVECDGIR